MFMLFLANRLEFSHISLSPLAVVLLALQQELQIGVQKQHGSYRLLFHSVQGNVHKFQVALDQL
jgi:hypothetical protein